MQGADTTSLVDANKCSFKHLNHHMNAVEQISPFKGSLLRENHIKSITDPFDI